MMKQFSKFIVVGGISTIINYGVFFIVLKMNIDYLLASSLGYIAGLVVGYFFNRHWTFTEHKSSTQQNREMVLYVLVYGLSLLLSLGSLHILVATFHILATLANVLVIGQSTITNFIGLKLLVFKHHTNATIA